MMGAMLFTNGDAATQYTGQVVRQSGSSVFLALADTTAHVEKLVGVRLSDVTTGNSGFIAWYVAGVKIRCEAEPTVGNELWLSATNAGMAALAAPAIEVLLGVCYTKEEIGGVWFAEVIPESLVRGGGTGTTDPNDVACVYKAFNNITTAYTDVLFSSNVALSDAAVIDHSTSTNTNRVTAKVAGYYQLFAIGQIRLDEVPIIDDVNNGCWNARFAKNGTAIAQSESGGAYANIYLDFEYLVRNQTLVVCGISVLLAANDYVTFQLNSTDVVGSPATVGSFSGSFTVTLLKRT